MSTTPLKIYFAPNTRAVRIVWLCEELGLPYELERFELGEKRMREPGYTGIHPLGRVPALDDEGTVVYESGAIVEYILARHGGGRLVPPSNDPRFAQYLQWLHFAEGMLMPQVNIIVVETIFLPEEKRNEVNVSRATRLLSRMLTAVNERLEGRSFLADDFSGADIMTGHACIVSARLGADVSDKPNVAAYVERLKARPAYERAMSA